MLIVVVDDDPIARELLAEYLKADGHTVHAAANGEEGLRLLEKHEARVLITDWEMPVLDGPGLARRVRSAAWTRYIYIVLLTSLTGKQNMIDGLRAGADDFMNKPFDPDQLTVRLSVAERILALESRDLAIFAMAKLAESRDPDTGAHLDRVRRLCELLARELAKNPARAREVTPEFVRLIYATSPLHDIGKVGIPDAVLLKPGRLDEAEFEIMKKHTAIGAATLSEAIRAYPNASFLSMARDIAEHHHERFDGTGYPRGLRGEQIPLCARIMALADVYDALTSKRVYKPAYPHALARQTIVEQSGKHFDPDVVAAFLACESEFVRVSSGARPDPVARAA